MRLNYDIEHVLRLTLAVYRVIELFPEEGKKLKSQIRESANYILADLFLDQPTLRERDMATYSVLPTRPSGSPHPNPFVRSHITLSNQIEKIMGLFDLAEGKNWVNPKNFLVLKREYQKIEERIKSSGKTVENSFPKNNHRQEKILEVVKGNSQTKMGDLVKFFPGVNRRTVLRDLERFSRLGVLARNGSGRGAYYVARNATIATIATNVT